jgi:hypothetical protein
MNPIAISERKIYEKWSPKLEKKFGEAAKQISEAKMKTLAKMCHTRKIHESAATVNNVVGRGSFNLGNNPNTGNAGFYDPAQMGSGEVFQNLFGIFVEVAAFNIGMELVPVIPMTKSSGSVYIAEPVYAGGRLESSSDKPIVIQVKTVKNGTPTALVVGTVYTVRESFAVGTDKVIDLTYVGKHRINGNDIFKIGTTYTATGGTGVNYATKTVAEALDTVVNGAGIYDSAVNFWGFDGGVDYVAGFTNFISGFSGAGINDTDDWSMNRGSGKHYGSPMSRQTGERSTYRSMGIRTWSRNFNADTVHVDLEYTTEQIQDMQMDHGMNAMEFGESILQDQLNQHINEHILGRMFALGWGHHYEMNAKNGFNLNAFIASAASTGSAQTFLDHTDTSRTVAGPAGVLPSTGAISENLNSLQRRVITRLLYASGIVNQRSRRGRGDQAVLNTTFSTAVKDVRGFQAAPFPNDINDAGLYLTGSLYGIKVYEDPLMELNDERINVSRHGNEKDPGLKMCPYILAEKISTIAEGTMAPKEALKSRYKLVEAGTYPQLNYLTFTVQTDAGYSIV